MLVTNFMLFTNPAAAWARIHASGRSATRYLLAHTALLALIPAVCGYYGTTHTGWQIGDSPLMRLAERSALLIAVMYYVAMVLGTATLGWMIHWMSRTYGARQPFSQCVALATYAATPIFLAGAITLQPILWINLLVGLGALAYAVFLRYAGTPILMEIPRERGFLYSSAIVAFGLAALVAFLALTVLLWSWGLQPTFVRAS